MEEVRKIEMKVRIRDWKREREYRYRYMRVCSVVELLQCRTVWAWKMCYPSINHLQGYNIQLQTPSDSESEETREFAKLPTVSGPTSINTFTLAQWAHWLLTLSRKTTMLASLSKLVKSSYLLSSIIIENCAPFSHYYK